MLAPLGDMRAFDGALLGTGVLLLGSGDQSEKIRYIKKICTTTNVPDNYSFYLNLAFWFAIWWETGSTNTVSDTLRAQLHWTILAGVGMQAARNRTCLLRIGCAGALPLSYPAPI
jgi:hypothetical protein